MKSLCRHKQNGDIFAIATDPQGNIISASGPLLFDNLNPRALDYDDYWNAELSAKLADFDRITKDDYLELLRKNGFFPQMTQRYLF